MSDEPADTREARDLEVAEDVVAEVRGGKLIDKATPVLQQGCSTPTQH